MERCRYCGGVVSYSDLIHERSGAAVHVGCKRKARELIDAARRVEVIERDVIGEKACSSCGSYRHVACGTITDGGLREAVEGALEAPMTGFQSIAAYQFGADKVCGVCGTVIEPGHWTCVVCSTADVPVVLDACGVVGCRGRC